MKSVIKSTWIWSVILFGWLLSMSVPVFGQNAGDEYVTEVKLKDGSVIEGRLTEYRDGEYIRLQIGEAEITIKFESIRQIKHKNRSVSRTYAFRETGWYHHTSAGVLPGFISAGNPVVGAEIDHSSGWLFNRNFGAGLHAGVSNYDPQSAAVFYSLAGELTGFLMKQNFSPYYAIRSGYGFTRKGNTFVEASGGYFLHPALGFRFTGMKTANITAELGLAFQKGYFKQQTDWWDRSIIEKNVRYQRISMKIGILF